MKNIIKLDKKGLDRLIESIAKTLIVENNQTYTDFTTEVPVEFDYHYQFEGRDVWSVNLKDGKTINVTFDITVYTKRSGIDSLLLHNVRGPRVIPIQIELEPLNDDDEDYTYEHDIHVNWDIANVKYDNLSSDYYDSLHDMPKTIDNISISLDRGLFVDGITVYPYS